MVLWEVLLSDHNLVNFIRKTYIIIEINAEQIKKQAEEDANRRVEEAKRQAGNISISSYIVLLGHII